MRSILFRMAATVFLIPCAAYTQSSRPLPYLDGSLSNEQRVNDLVSRMTLEEKVSQLINSAKAIPRLNVPAYDWWSEGLHGVARSGYATMFPQAIGMASTWDAPLIGQIGTTISTEARAKYNDAVSHDLHAMYYGLTFWSPNINIFRDPRWGRGQETYGEDPFLTGRLGVAFIRGLQGDDPKYFKVIATPKHYAVHSGPEESRHRFDVAPTPHDLWDTYLPAFRAAITEGKAFSIMCAYNAVDKLPVCANQELLQNVLRKDWGFQGFVTSDCGAVDDFYSQGGHRFSEDKDAAAAAGILAGTDTSCGDTYLALASAVQRGLISEAQIDVSLKRLFLARYRLGLFDSAADVAYAKVPFSEVGSPAHHELALRAARESIVLLKNSGHTLPFAKDKVKTIAVIGPNAAELASIEGNYNAIPRDPILPVDGIVRQFPEAKVLYAQGSPFVENVSLTIPRTQFRVALGSADEGLKGEYFNNETLSGQPAMVRTDKQIDFDWNSTSPVPSQLDPKGFSVRWTGTIQVPAAGDYPIDAAPLNCYPCGGAEHYSVSFDGEELINSDATGDGAQKTAVTFHFADTQPHSIVVTYSHHEKLSGAGLSLHWLPSVDVLRAQAMAIVATADVIVAFAGLSPNLEGEEMPVQVHGFSRGDRTDISLPAAQQQLLEAAKATGKPLVVVLMSGSALGVNWAEQHAEAMLEAWYPGEAGGQAIAETLDGENNPAGRLPITFYSSIKDLLPFDDYSMANRTYRYFHGKPLYGFGYGLSYTNFTYGKIKLSKTRLRAGETLSVETEIKNTGSSPGDEVAELYLIPPHTDVSPALSLAGFTRVHIAPGASKHVTFTLDARALSQVDRQGIRAVTPGSYRVAVGSKQPGDGASGQTATFTIDGSLGLPR